VYEPAEQFVWTDDPGDGTNLPGDAGVHTDVWTDGAYEPVAHGVQFVDMLLAEKLPAGHCSGATMPDVGA
jgi:hypothetical protein